MGTGTTCRYSPWSLEVPDLNSGAGRFCTSRDGAGFFLGGSALGSTRMDNFGIIGSSPLISLPVSTSWYLMLPIARLWRTRRISPMLYYYWIGYYLTDIIIYPFKAQPRWRLRLTLTDASFDIHSLLLHLSFLTWYTTTNEC